MNIQKAIEIKKLHAQGHWPADNPDVKEADRLSIEAMKAVDFARKNSFLWYSQLLPGETEK